MLDDFVEGRTKSVAGNENQVRLDKALTGLRAIEADLERLFPLTWKGGNPPDND